jgi:3-hydroxybutyryl-CoA dehydrogenase
MFATRGGEVRIFDKKRGAGEAARQYVAANVAEVAGRIDGGRPGHATVTDDMAEAVAGTWLVVEAVPEILDLNPSWRTRSRPASSSTASGPPS